jgi:hypothetical protein
MTMKFKPTKPKGKTFGQLKSGEVFRVTPFGDLYLRVDSNGFRNEQDTRPNTLCFTDHKLYHTLGDDEVFPTTLIVEEE